MSELIAIMRWGADLSLALLSAGAMLAWLTKGNMVLRGSLSPLLALVLIVLLAAQIAVSAHLAAPGDGLSALSLFALETWSGKVLLLRLLLALLLALSLRLGHELRLPGVGLLAASLFLVPFSGHAASASPAAVSLALHGLHTAAVLTWSGTVILLAWFAITRRDGPDLFQALRGFSPIALALTAAGIASGLSAAWLQIGRPAALFGTPYGQLLLLKVFGLLVPALASAAWLRWRYLPQGGRLTPCRALAVEAALCAAMLAIASIMSQSVPGRHDDIIWPLPFRFDAQLLSPGRETATILIGHLLAAGAMLLAAAAGAALRRWTFTAATGCAGLLIGGLGLSGLAVEAYPTSFAVSPSAYSADRLISAEAVFKAHCAVCHGETGHGDGPGLSKVRNGAADLTAPHAGDHTAGDMYWWITHGRAGTAMPGAEAETTEQDRWDLVNYVRLLANSAMSAGVGGSVVPIKPLLPSIDFGFTTPQGEYASLRDSEAVRPVFLLLVRDASAPARLAELEARRAAIEAQGLLVVVVCGLAARNLVPDTDRGSAILVVKTDSDAIIRSWSYYARREPDAPVADIGHQEYLIDRFGYVRARWMTGTGGLPSVAEVLEDVKQLAAEPRLKPPLDDHLHP